MTCFNGATAFRRWKLLGGVNGWFMQSQLQWGHRLSAMETWLEAYQGRFLFGMLQWGHRLSAMETL